MRYILNTLKMQQKNDNGRMEEYRAFIYSYLPFKPCIDVCLDAPCCRHFNQGARISMDEREAIAEAAKNLGLEDTADYILQNNRLPVREGEPVYRDCSLLEDGRCLLNNKAKPGVCTQYPVFIMEESDYVRVAVDTACVQVSTKDLLHNQARMKGEFKRQFEKDLELVIGNFIDEQLHRIYNEEP